MALGLDVDVDLRSDGEEWDGQHPSRTPGVEKLGKATDSGFQAGQRMSVHAAVVLGIGRTRREPQTQNDEGP